MTAVLVSLVLVSAVSCGDDDPASSSNGADVTEADLGEDTPQGSDAGGDSTPDTASEDLTTEDTPAETSDTGTSDAETSDTETPDSELDDVDDRFADVIFPNEPGGNPLVPEFAPFPFPSDYYLVEDESTLTGRVMVVPTEVMPRRFTSELFSGFDGFSRIPPILSILPGGTDVESLPSPTDHAESISEGSSVWLVREDTWVKVPILAEMDATEPDPALSAIIIRPLVTLEENTGYVVILRDTLRRLDGMPHEAGDVFVALRDGIPTDDPAVEVQRDDFVLVNAAIAGVGLDPDEVVLAWSFHTRSEEQVVRPLLHMQQVANVAPMSDYTITRDEQEGSNRQIEGHFMVPNFASPDTGTLILDDEGLPTQFGERQVPFVMTIPDTVDEPRPLILYGHGFFGYRTQATYGSYNRLLAANRMSTAAVEIGFHGDVAFLIVGSVAGTPGNMHVAMAEVLQSFANMTFLNRLVREVLAEDLTAEGPDGTYALIDPDAVHYLGISNGGTFGYVQAATSPQLERAVMVVGGGGLVHFLERAVQWAEYGQGVDIVYPNPLDQQMLWALVQQVLDHVDSMNYASHLVDDRFEGMRPLRAQVHMAVNDSQVRNLITEWVMRTANIPVITPTSKDIYGLETITAALPDGADPSVMGALYVYDEQLEPSPITNIPPAEDNGAHGTIRDLGAYQEHVGRFLEDGTFIQVCDGGCDPE